MFGQENRHAYLTANLRALVLQYVHGDTVVYLGRMGWHDIAVVPHPLRMGSCVFFAFADMCWLFYKALEKRKAPDVSFAQTVRRVSLSLQTGLRLHWQSTTISRMPYHGRVSVLPICHHLNSACGLLVLMDSRNFSASWVTTEGNTICTNGWLMMLPLYC